jgi:hypothetical protein
MTSEGLSRMTVEQLVRRFREVAVEQGQSLWDDDNPKFNRLYDRMKEVRLELKRREGDPRRALLPHLRHPNA